ncbi:L-ascorbate oxidase-like protein [Senna tora]|uniref:L-ascorbate oxidase-like protein n=1 Tax=Senna tora TaxID=362788 RepID=A0A834WN35_9FABA|nr:L-ascorbate oxidase-like protein [Senna tora]
MSQDSGLKLKRREWDWDSRPAKDPNAPKTTSSFVECERWEVIKAPNLILHLKNVSEILPRWDGACCS